MDNMLDDVLVLSGEIAQQEETENDLSVTAFGEKLVKSKDIEFLWVARNASSSAKKATTTIKKYSDEKMSEDVLTNGSIRLGNQVFVYSKSSSWKVSDISSFVEWIVSKSENKEEIVEDIIAILGKSFVPKLMGLDAVAKKRGKDPKVIRDTFLYKEWKEQPDLKSINTGSNSAPKWVHELSHGERRK